MLKYISSNNLRIHFYKKINNLLKIFNKLIKKIKNNLFCWY
jgi:hypothetical protein